MRAGQYWWNNFEKTVIITAYGPPDKGGIVPHKINNSKMLSTRDAGVRQPVKLDIPLRLFFCG